MIEIDIPGRGKLILKYLVMDYNGTLAIDGILIKGVKEKLLKLSNLLDIHVVTADTFGIAASQLEDLPCSLKILGKDNQRKTKEEYITELGSSSVVSIGNGRNDSLMLKTSALGIAVIQEEGTAIETLINADITAKDINDALNLLLHTKRVIATLRS